MKNKKQCYDSVFVCDFETLHADTAFFKALQEKDTRIILWYAKELNENKDTNGNEAIGVDGDGWFNWIKSLKKNTTIFFHNTGFDGEFIIPILLDHGLKMNNCHYENETNTLSINQGYRIKKQLTINYSQTELKPNYFDVFRSSGKIYNIKIHFKNSNKNGYDFFVSIRCSLMMLSNSVSNLGKVYQNETFLDKQLIKMFENEKQLGNDFYKVEPVFDLKEMKKDFIDYCKRDVEIVRRSLIDFEKAINELPTMQDYLDKVNKKLFKQYLKKKKPYKKQTKINIYQKAITVAALGRWLMLNIYVPRFQKSCKDYYPNNLFKHNQAKYGSFLLIDENTYDFINSKDSRYYFGAFTQYNPKYQSTFENKDNKKLNSGIKIDVVSAYPFQMTKSLPYGEIMDEPTFYEFYLKDNPHWIQGVDYIEFIDAEIEKCTPKDIAKHCPILRNWDKKQLINDKPTRYINQPICNFNMKVIRDEWEELQHWGDFKVKQISYHYMLACPYLKDYATEVISQKTKYGKENNLSFKQAMKILANSAYGGLGMRKEFDNMIQMDESFEELVEEFNKHKKQSFTKFNMNLNNITNPKQVEADFSGLSLSKSIGDLNCIRIKTPTNKKWFYNVAAASTITALQRVYIWQTIRNIGPQYFAYSDTDSIIFVNYDKETETKIKAMLGDDLGQWELEKDNLQTISIKKAKDYAVGYMDNGKLKVDIKLAGFNANTDLHDIITDYHINDSEEYLQDSIFVKNASTSKVKYKHGLILVDIDKINSKGEI